MYMGAIPDPYSGQRLLHLDLSRHHIDTLAILEAKTKGNLTEEESTTLTQSLAELRQVFVQLSQQVAAQSGDLKAAAQVQKDAEAQAKGSSGDAKPAGGGIHMP